jgi:hypothetical protein
MTPKSPHSALIASWIGHGKLYKDVPEAILNEVVSQTTISAQLLSDLLPLLQEATITQLRNYLLPRQSLTTDFFTPKSRFSCSTPNLSLEDLVKQKDWPIPALSTINQL